MCEIGFAIKDKSDFCVMERWSGKAISIYNGIHYCIFVGSLVVFPHINTFIFCLLPCVLSPLQILGILDFGREAWIHREDWIHNGIHVASGRKYKDSYYLQAQAMCCINSWSLDQPSLAPKSCTYKIQVLAFIELKLFPVAFCLVESLLSFCFKFKCRLFRSR